MIVKRFRGCLSVGSLALFAMSGCSTSGSQSPEGRVIVPGDGMLVSGDDARLVIPEIEEDRHLSVALIAVDSLDRPGSRVKVTREPRAGMAAFVEVVAEASASDVRRGFSTLGMSYIRFPDDRDSPMITYVQATDHISYRYDNDPFFDEVSEAVATLRSRDRMSFVDGYGEAVALVMGGRISEMIGNTRTLVRDP